MALKVASVFPINMLEMQILEPHSRPPESEILEWSSAISILTNLLDDSDQHSRLYTTYFVEYPILPHHNHTNQGINTGTLP